MKEDCFRITMGTLVLGLFANLVCAAAAQPARDLAALTVPEDRLPASCRLKPVEPKPPMRAQGSVVIISGDSGPNPWIGRDRKTVADVRRMVDGAPPELDGPPLMPREAAAFALRWADNVVEAYRATYRLTDESLINVAAVRFDDEQLATPAPPPGTRTMARGITSRVVLGPIVVLISAGASSDCFRAIESYVRSRR